ncbi:MAG: cupin domain-containing protein [Atopobiaceae bacterium]|nr:cupin domain-containing protein [Atopobiaceae bacterium]
MEFIEGNSVQELSNPGVISRQLLCPNNSESTRVTITEVHLDAGAMQPRHTHASSEQIWYALKGKGTLLLADDVEQAFFAGDVVRFADGDVHGLHNTGDDEFVYLSVTAPPIDFGYAYRDMRRG